MKQFYLSIFSLAAANFCFGQHSINTTDLPAVGDVYQYYFADTVGVQPGNSGSGQTWNFTAYAYQPTPGQMTYVAPSTTPMASDFPNSTVAENDNTDYSFYRLSGSTWQLDGMELTVSGITARAVFSDQGVIFNSFPFGFGSTTPSDNISGTITGGLTGTTTGTIATDCDGSGTLMLQGGTFTNCIRVKMIINLSMNITAPFPTTATYSETRYSYFDASSKFPLWDLRYTTISSGFGTTNTKTVYQNASTVTGIKNVNSGTSISVFPVPANETLNLKMNLEQNSSFNIEIINQLGQIVYNDKIENAKSGQFTKKIDISSLSSGIYFLRTKNESFNTIGKFIVE